MTDSFIPHDIDAYQIHGKGWIGRYSAPGLGIEYVRDGAGLIRIHPTEDAARTAAVEARDHALNRMEREKRSARSLGSKVFRVQGSCRSRFVQEAR